MKLKSFGCSFVFGTDLPIDRVPKSLYSSLPNQSTYPALIAQRLGMIHSCHARPGAGNFEILNHILSEISKQEPSLFVINWTWIDRFSYINEAKKESQMPNRLPVRNPLGWDSILPIDDSESAKIYYKNLHNQLRDKIETLTCIKMAIDNIRSQGHQFIMTWTDDLIWEDQWHCPDSVKWLQDQVRPWMKDFEGSSFLDWSRKKGFEISENLHPMEDAHRAAADFILANLDDFVIGNQ